MFKKRAHTQPARMAGTPEEEACLEPDRLSAYEPPELHRLGTVYELTRGSSSHGKSDANSQYYW